MNKSRFQKKNRDFRKKSWIQKKNRESLIVNRKSRIVNHHIMNCIDRHVVNGKPFAKLRFNHKINLEHKTRRFRTWTNHDFKKKIVISKKKSWSQKKNRDFKKKIVIHFFRADVFSIKYDCSNGTHKLRLKIYVPILSKKTKKMLCVLKIFSRIFFTKF